MIGESRIYPVFIAGQHRAIAGHVYGRRQPSLMVSVKSAVQISARMESPYRADLLMPMFRMLNDELGIELANSKDDSKIAAWSTWLICLGNMTLKLLHGIGFPAADPVKILHLPASGCEHEIWSTLLLPVMPGRPSSTLKAWQISLQTYENFSRFNGSSENNETLLKGVAELKALLPKGANTARFLKAAYEKQVPVFPLGMDIFQFGQASQSQWFDSTSSLQTPSIAMKMARNKQATAARLRQAGLPVPLHRRVASFKDACSAALDLGYPVVVKPLDQDGGKGVMAAIDNESELRTAFDHAKSFSTSVLVEKHIFGRDYRLTVLDGKLLWAIERLPAGVTGDGTHSISDLVAIENSNPRRGDGAHAVLKYLLIDEDVELVLNKQGLTLRSVPSGGQFVFLKRIANVASGGLPVAVNHKIHPDNAQLAILAAQALRLDIAGIDLLIPDIARSWRQGGSAICEVNAQPQLGATTGPHLYGQILEKRLAGQGRIPIFLVLGSDGADGLMHELIANFRAAGLCVGWRDDQATCVGDDQQVDMANSFFMSGQKLLTDLRVDVMVLALNDHALLSTGLPTDLINGLVIAGRYTSKPMSDQAIEMTEDATFLKKVLPVLLPSVSGPVFCLKNCGVDLQDLRNFSAQDIEFIEAEKIDILQTFMSDSRFTKPQ
jgi:cyanophycin synthetase